MTPLRRARVSPYQYTCYEIGLSHPIIPQFMNDNEKDNKQVQTVAYLGFQKGGGGETPRWWGAGEGSEKKIIFTSSK